MMIFILLYFPCIATVMAIAHEAGGLEICLVFDSLQHLAGLERGFCGLSRRSVARNVECERKMKSHGTDRAIFAEDMKIIELIDADYGLLSILLRLDIQLPFGDISIGEMCRRYDMSSALFLMICRMYACPDYEPDSASLTAPICRIW